MTVQTALFYIFASVMLFAAMRVVTARNTVHAVLYLVLAFSQASMLWMLLKAEFLAITLILVYVGAVMVLFLFVVMMLDIKIDSRGKGYWARFGLATILGLVVALEIIAVVTTMRVDAPAVDAAAQMSNTAALGKLLYSEYVMPVQVAAVILLVAIIAAIALTLRERKDSKYVNPAQQVRVRAHERMEVVKVPVSQLAPVAESTPVLEPAAQAAVSPAVAPPVSGAKT